MTLLRMLAFEPAASAGSPPVGQPSAPRAVPGPRAAATAAAAKPAAAPADATTRQPAVAAAPAAPVARPAADAPAQPDGRAAGEPPAAAAATAVPAATAPAQPAAAVVDAPVAASGAAVAKSDPPASPAEPESRAEAAVAAPAESAPRAAPAEPAARPVSRIGGAAAALDVLRNAGMRVSTDRSRPAAAAQPAAAKPTAPRPAVQVPTPRAAARAPQSDTRQAPPPWEDIPPDEYVPLSADEMFGGPPDDGFVPVFDSGPDDVRIAPKPAEARPSAPLDTRPLPPAIALDPIGFDGEWPALAARLPLKGVAYQLAFNSELTAVDATTLKLSVPVPQYADAAQVAKLKAALADALGKPVDVAVEVGPARRTAAALDAAARGASARGGAGDSRDPFVQQLVREFGARIVDGSVRPLADAAAPADGAPPTLH